jgi:hypothetical protein
MPLVSVKERLIYAYFYILLSDLITCLVIFIAFQCQISHFCRSGTVYIILCYKTKSFQNIFVPEQELQKREYNAGLQNFYSLLNTNRMIKSGRMRWAEHVACKGRRYTV